MMFIIHYTFEAIAWLTHVILEFFRNWKAAAEVEAQFFNATGHPIYRCTFKEARAYRESGMTPHQWLSRRNP